MSPTFYGALALGLALLVAHRIFARRYLEEYIAVYQHLPARDWLLKTDNDAIVEKWRRRRLAVLIPMLLILGALLLSVLSPAS